MDTDNRITDITKPEIAPVLHSAPKKTRRTSRKSWLIGIGIVVWIALALSWSWWLFGRNTNYDENKGVKSSEFQAVFLTNGQVYFGKLSNLNHKYVTLSDIFYLQVQQSGNSLQNASSSTTSDSQVSLAKLGSELHGPEDKMSISSDQILFWENMKSDSKVVQAIDKYQSR